MSSSVLHLRDVEREAVLPALDAVLAGAGFARRDAVPVAAGGPYSTPGHDEAISAGPCYVVSPRCDRWLCVLRAHGYIQGGPEMIAVGQQLSKAMRCAALNLDEHDGDVLMYGLHRNGSRVDEYNSFPPHLRYEHNVKYPVEQMRHRPDAFEELLPPGRTLAELRQLLDRGWWAAHTPGRLDGRGLPLDLRSGFAFESERMTTLGELLALYPAAKTYPFAAWADATDVDWSSFIELRYAGAQPRT